MNRAPPFSTSELVQLLDQITDRALTLKQGYVLLATGDAPQDTDPALASLSTWPTDIYREAEPLVRHRALRWLIGTVAGGSGADAVNRRAACEKRDVLVRELGAYAKWFRASLLLPRLAGEEAWHRSLQQWAIATAGTRHTDTWMATFYAASAEMLKRYRDLNTWLARREKSSDYDKAHAGWVALRESPHFFHPELKQRMETVSRSIGAYREK